METARIDLKITELTGQLEAARKLPVVAGHENDMKAYQAFLAQVETFIKQAQKVREKGEYEAGHLKGSVNIPLSELRERTDEIPKDRPVYLHCRSSQRSYNALMALQGRGYENVVNISGSFLGICLYEYYNDVAMGREKIVTEYNFA